MTRRTQWQHNLTDYQIDDHFLREMTLAGLDFRKDDLPLKVDGKTHYVRCSNRSAKNRNSKSGWYCAHYGVYPKVSFGWLHGNKATFAFSLYEYLKDKGQTQRKVLSDEEIALQEQERLKQIYIRELREKELYDFSRALTIIEYVRSSPLTSNHPYQVEKKFSIDECQSARRYNRNNYTPQELRAILSEHYPEYNTNSNIRKLIDYQVEHIPYRGDNLLIVGRTLDDNFVMFQLIFNKKAKNGKNKHFPKNTVKHKTFTLLGQQINEDTQAVIICEGWATGLSLLRLHPEATILVAWDSGNMVAVAMQVRARLPNCKIYSANDNDHTKPDDKNAGMIGGEKIANMVGAYLIPPPFDANDPKQEHWSDWNDFDLHLPFEAVQRIFNQVFQTATFSAAQYDPESMFDIVNDNEPLEEFNDRVDHRKNAALFTACISTNTLGIHYVFDSLEEYKKVYFSEVESVINPNNEIQSLDEYKYDRKFIGIVMKFQSELLLSNKPLLSEDAVFKSMFDHVLAYNQTLEDIELMPIIHSIISKKYGDELAKASLIFYGQKIGIYRDQFKFLNALIPELSKHDFIRNLDQDLLFNVLLNVNEYDFWQYSSKTKRESKAIASLLKTFNQIEMNTISQV